MTALVMIRRPTLVLMLLSIFWILPGDAQGAPQDSPSWFLSVREGQLTANINRIPLRLVLEELARQVPLRLSVSEGWGDHLVTAHFRALPLEEALERLLAGSSYAIIYAPAHSGEGSAATRQIVELMVFENAPAAKVADSSEASDPTSNTGPGPEPTPEWAEALEDPDPSVRLRALDRLAQPSASTTESTTLDVLTQALVDPDESVRAKAQELVEQVWAAKAEER